MSGSENDEDVEFVLTAVPMLLVHIPVDRMLAKTQHLLQALTTCRGVSGTSENPKRAIHFKFAGY